MRVTKFEDYEGFSSIYHEEVDRHWTAVRVLRCPFA